LNSFEKSKINNLLISKLEHEILLIKDKSKDEILIILEKKLSIEKPKLDLVVTYILSKESLLQDFINELSSGSDSIRSFRELIISTRNLDIHNSD